MKLKQNIPLSTGTFEYDDQYLIPDQSMTIGEMIDRHIDNQSVSNHENEAVDDPNLDSPLRYDSELTDVKTKYQDKDYFEALDTMRRSIGAGALDSNPKNLSSHEQVSTNTPESVPSNSPSGEGAR